MSREEADRALLKAMLATAEALGHDISPNTAAVMVEDLAAYPVQRVLAALAVVRRDGRGRLTLKAVLDRLGAGAGHIGANEAWALVQRAADETAAIVWTGEMQRAWEVVRPMLMDGDRPAARADKIGARVAFIEAYERFVGEARAAGRGPEIMLSRGSDATSTATALERAAAVGMLVAKEAMPVLLRLEDETGAASLPSPRPDRPRLGFDVGGWNTGLAAPLIAASQNEDLLPEQREQLRDLIADLKRNPMRRAQEADKAFARGQNALEELKRTELAKLADSNDRSG